jgi:hypothetical protein
MTHDYAVTSATYVLDSAPDPLVTIVGTVDGVDVTVQIWLSAINQAKQVGGIQAVKNLVSPIMLSQAIINNPPTPQPPVNLPTGSWSQ